MLEHFWFEKMFSNFISRFLTTKIHIIFTMFPFSKDLDKKQHKQ